jgi:hypothetical protein
VERRAAEWHPQPLDTPRNSPGPPIFWLPSPRPTALRAPLRARATSYFVDATFAVADRRVVMSLVASAPRAGGKPLRRSGHGADTREVLAGLVATEHLSVSPLDSWSSRSEDASALTH